MVKVVPPIKHCWSEVAGRSLYISGLTYAGATYSVTVSDRLKDTLGQKLAAPVTLKFTMDPYDANLYMASENFITSASCMPKDFYMYTVNYPVLETKVYAVKAEEYSKFQKSSPSDWLKSVTRKPLLSKKIRLNQRTDRLCQTKLDLAGFFPSGYGHLVVTAQPFGLDEKADLKQLRAVWIQSTDIALNAWHDEKDMRVFASRLTTGQPLEAVQLSLGSARASTTKDGFGAVPLPETDRCNVLIARHKSDSAVLRESEYNNSQGWLGNNDSESTSRWYFFTDRGVYKPGSEVNFKGWLRNLPRVPGKELTAISSGKVVVDVNDQAGKNIFHGTVALNEFGGFHGKFATPENMAVGTAQITVQTANNEYNHTSSSVLIADYRPPDFSLKVAPKALPMVAGGNIVFDSSASYYSGGPLARSTVNWNVQGSSSNYTPNGWSEYVFEAPDCEDQTFSQSFSATTNTLGEHSLMLKIPPVLKKPASVTVNAEVQDINRETHSSSSTQIIHPSDLYVGLKSNTNFVVSSEQVPWSLIVCDLDGKPVHHKKVRLSLKREVITKDISSWKLVNTFVRESAAHPLSETLVCNKSGNYRLEATVTDARGRNSCSAISFYAASFEGVVPSGSENIVLKLDKQTYEPGETARLLVRSKKAQAQGILLTEHNGISTSRSFALKNGYQMLNIPIEDWQASQLKVSVTLLGSGVDKVLSEVVSAAADIDIAYTKRKLHVSCRPDNKKTVPGAETGIVVHVEDHTKKAMPHCEVAVAVVDDAVLELTEYQLPDFDGVWRQHYVSLASYDLQNSIRRFASSDFREQLRTEFPGLMLEEMEKAAPGHYRRSAVPAGGFGRSCGGGGAGGANASPIFIERENFNPLAVFVGSAISDNNGNIRLRYKLPDSLTRYRIMAVATDGGKKFGRGEALVTVSLPLSVKPSAPRFLNFKDQFQLPVTVRNTTDKPLEAMVAVRGNTKELKDGGGKLIRVPANDRVEIRFSTTAESLGKLNFQAAVASGERTDAIDFAVPVLMPATTETMTTSGRINDGDAVRLELEAPRDALVDYGGLEVNTGATIAGEGLGAIQYLHEYPYQCSEQLSSRILCYAISKNMAKHSESRSVRGENDMQKLVASDIKLLCSRQSKSGAFGLWKPNDEFETYLPFVTVYATHALSIARSRGFSVPENVISLASNNLKALETLLTSKHSVGTPGYERISQIAGKDDLLSYLYYVRHNLGEDVSLRAEKLAISKMDEVSTESLSWLLMSMCNNAACKNTAEKLRGALLNRVNETATAASITKSGYSSSANYSMFYSPNRDEAVLIQALLYDNPQNTLITKLTTGLLAARKDGHWMNTQENAFSLLALDSYLERFEKSSPDFTARIWLAQNCIAENQYKGRGTESNTTVVPIRQLQSSSKDLDLILQKQGPGALYYRAMLKYALAKANLPAMSQGFNVTRLYEANNKKDVYQDKAGLWHIKAGALVKVRITMVAPGERHHVMLLDPLPAGLEAINPELSGQAPVQSDSSSSRWWQSNWFAHQAMRDAHVEAYTSLLQEGQYEYTYFARATTLGTFTAPPAKAEEMYTPDTFGRSKSDRLVVE